MDYSSFSSVQRIDFVINESLIGLETQLNYLVLLPTQLFKFHETSSLKRKKFVLLLRLLVKTRKWKKMTAWKTHVFQEEDLHVNESHGNQMKQKSLSDKSFTKKWRIRNFDMQSRIFSSFPKQWIHYCHSRKRKYITPSSSKRSQERTWCQ